METDLYNWIIAKREAGAVLDSLAIKQKALAIFHKISQEQNSIYIHIKFLASSGCFRNFCCRSLENLTLSTTGRDLPVFKYLFYVKS